MLPEQVDDMCIDPFAVAKFDANRRSWGYGQEVIQRAKIFNATINIGGV